MILLCRKFAAYRPSAFAFFVRLDPFAPCTEQTTSLAIVSSPALVQTFSRSDQAFALGVRSSVSQTSIAGPYQMAYLVSGASLSAVIKLSTLLLFQFI